MHSTSGLTTANIGLDNARFTHPVYVGDTLYAETEILTRRHSGSRPGEGIVTCATRAVNQDGVPVLQFERTFLVPLDPTGVRDAPTTTNRRARERPDLRLRRRPPEPA